MDATGFTTTLEAAQDPLIIGLDVGSTASRGGLYDAAARPIDERRFKIPHVFTTAADGTSIIDPDQIVDELAAILDALAGSDVAGRVAGVGLDTFSSSLVGVDASGRALTPAFTYADSRCAPQLATLRAELDEAEIQQRNGTRLHTSYLAPRLLWLRETDPATFDAVTTWMSLGEYVHQRLLGTSAAGTSVAAWTGLLNRHTGAWDDILLGHIGLDPAAFNDLADPDQPLFDTGNRIAQRWPALTGVPFFAPLSDGIASNVGTGADARTIVVAAATSGAMRVLVDGVPEVIPPGLWCYKIDRNRSLLGGALNDVGRAVTWLQSVLLLPDAEGIDAALAAEPVPDTPVVLPYFTGERSTGWNGRARAVLSSVSVASTPATIFRGTMEGVVQVYARVADQLRLVAPDAGEFLVSGRVTQDWPSLQQVMADVLGAPVTPLTIKRATLRGTALLALESLAPNVPRAHPDRGSSFVPMPHRTAYYAAQGAEFDRLYTAVLGGQPTAQQS